MGCFLDYDIKKSVDMIYMKRDLHNDMFNLFSEINKEINALPKNKRIKIKKLYLELLENEIKKEKDKYESNSN